MNKEEFKRRVIASSQVAFFGSITPEMRMITGDFDEETKDITVNIYFDGEVSELNQEMRSDISGEIISDYSDSEVHYVLENDIRCDYPNRIEIKASETILYKRYEAEQQDHEEGQDYESQILEIKNTDNLLYKLRLLSHLAFLGNITPEVRMINVEWNESDKNIDMNFYYDGEISELNIKLMNRIAEKMKLGFNKLNDYHIKANPIRYDYPAPLNKFINSDNHRLYRRYEPY